MLPVSPFLAANEAFRLPLRLRRLTLLLLRRDALPDVGAVLLSRLLLLLKALPRLDEALLSFRSLPETATRASFVSDLVNFCCIICVFQKAVATNGFTKAADVCSGTVGQCYKLSICNLLTEVVNMFSVNCIPK